MTNDEIGTVRKAAIETLENIPFGEVFSGADFKVMVCERYPQYLKKYVSSILRPLFDYNKEEGKSCALECINRHKSLYKKVTVEEYDSTHSNEKRVLVTESRFNELLDLEKRYKQLVANSKRRELHQQEFNFG